MAQVGFVPAYPSSPGTIGYVSSWETVNNTEVLLAQKFECQLGNAITYTWTVAWKTNDSQSHSFCPCQRTLCSFPNQPKKAVPNWLQTVEFNCPSTGSNEPCLKCWIVMHMSKRLFAAKKIVAQSMHINNHYLHVVICRRSDDLSINQNGKKNQPNNKVITSWS